jgi:hypothetical protein
MMREGAIVAGHDLGKNMFPTELLKIWGFV